MSGTTRTLAYQYDLEGNRSRITHPDGVYFMYNRDGLGRVCTLGESATALPCNTRIRQLTYFHRSSACQVRILTTLNSTRFNLQ
jgi:hypothetical protein